MTLLLDVDAVSKLSHWQLLPELPALLGRDWAAMSTITSLKPRTARATTAPDGKLFHTCEAAETALAALVQMPPLATPSPAVLGAFQDVAGIDPGEALLFALASEGGSREVLTGDKRAIKALAAMPPSLQASLQGRLLIVEQVVYLALQRHGLEWLRQRVCPQKGIDTAIAIVMGSRCDASEASVMDGLLSYVDEVGAFAGSMLKPVIPFPAIPAEEET